MTRDTALRFADLFAGRDDAVGMNEGRVERRPLTLEDYRQHLNGKQGIGVFPMRDDNTVRFGAIDLDEPNFDLARTLQRLIPGASYVERSRSGNAHVWVFFDSDAPAWAVRGVLKSATEAVGRPDVEIFPKQDALRPDMVGNYINLPYHGDSRPILSKHWVNDDGPLELGLLNFLELAEGAANCAADWERRARALGATPPEERPETSEWGTSPVLHECAEHIIANRETNPVRSGGRHQVMFHLAVQLLNWEAMSQREAFALLEKVNNAALPPLPYSELRRMFHNAVEGRYTFTGCDDPVMAPYVLPTCPIAQGKVGR